MRASRGAERLGPAASLVLASVVIVLTAVVPVARAAESLGDYYDPFTTSSYSGSAGTLHWTSSWEEVGDNDTAASGLFKVADDGACAAGPCLVIGKATGPDKNAKLTRRADLSGAATASLSFSYKRHKHGAGDGEVKLQIRVGEDWRTLQIFPLGVSDSSVTIAEYDITRWISPRTNIRFKVIGNEDDSHMNVDNVRIELFAPENFAPELDPIADATINEDAPFTFTATASDINDWDELSFALDGTAPSGAAMSADGTFTWTPDETQGPGVYSFDVVVTDSGLPPLSDSQTVTLTVAETNAPPVLASIGDQATIEGSLLKFTATATDPDTATAELRFSLAGSPPAGAAITADGEFTWTPSEAQGPGSYTFGIEVTDDGIPDGFRSDSETVTVTVTESNRAPVLAAIPDWHINEGSLLSFSAVATDPDQPANALTFQLSGQPSGATMTSGGSFAWTPMEDQGPGIYTFDVVVTDDGAPARSDTESVTVVVAEANIAPIIDPIGIKTVAEGSLLHFTATGYDTDMPADDFQFSLAGAPTGASITANGSFTWRPTELQGPATYHFDIVATDDGVPAQAGHAEVTVVVTEVNSPPTLAGIPKWTVVEGAAFSLNLFATDGDSPADQLTFSLDGAPEGAGITASGLFEWTPSESQGPGTYTFEVVVTDDGSPPLSDAATMTIRVLEGNNAPVIDPIEPIAATEGELVTFTATAVDPDWPADSFVFSLGKGAPAGATMTPAGFFAWTPGEAHGPGTHTFEVVATDDGSPARASSSHVTIDVSEANLPPRLGTASEYVIEAGLPYALTVSAADPDIPAQALRFAATGLPEGAELSAAGRLTWRPTEDMIGKRYVVTVTVTDNGIPALSDSGSFTLAVVRANVAPRLAPIGDRQLELGAALTFTAHATDEDGPDSALRFSLGAGAPAGAAIDAVSGDFSWRPTEAQYDARHTITVTVTDAGRHPKSDSAAFDVIVGRENTAPTLEDPGDQRSASGTIAAVAVRGSDPDGYPRSLAYSAMNLPPGLSIDAATGDISGTVGFDGIADSPFSVIVSVTDGRATTSVTFEWEIGLGANVGAPTPTRNAIVAGIADAGAPPVPPQARSDDVTRSFVIMARAARTSVSNMSIPFLLLFLLAGGVVALGPVGLVPVLRRGTRHEGTVRRYDPEAGCGLVTRASDGVDVFVHASAVSRRDRATLAVGDTVTFCTIDGAYRDLITKLQRRR